VLRGVNIALASKGARTVRVWRWSIEAYLHAATARALARAGEPSLAALLPHAREWWLRSEVERLLVCSDAHVLNLVRAEVLTARRDGKMRCVRIARQSLLRFLHARQLGA